MFMKKIIFFFTILLIGKTALAQPQPLLPSTTLEKWYPFCSATDLFDRTFTGFDLLTANTVSTSDRFGQPNKAYEFNGANSEMHYSAPFIIPAFGIADFTYSCHIFPTAAQDAIILYNGDPSTDGLGIVMNDGSFGGGPGNQVSMLFGGIAQSAGFPVTLNVWHHLLMRRNGNSYLLFVDGVQQVVYIPPVTPGYNPATTVFQLGIDFSGGTKPYTGKIDDVAIYGRQVSNPEVLALGNFNPNITFSLGPDIFTPNDTVIIGGGGAGALLDTINYPNDRFYPPIPPLAYEYLWGPTDSSTTLVVGFPPGSAAPPVVRTLTISRLYSCPFTDAINITKVVPFVNIGPDDTICDGETVVLNPSPILGNTYLWSTGATTPSITVAVTGTYWLRVDSMVVSGSDTTHFIGTDTAVIVVSPPTVVKLMNDTVLCQGGTVTLRSSVPYTAPIYAWSDGITTSDTFVVSTTGLYWLAVKDGACSDTDSVNVYIVYDTLTIFSPDTAICQGAFVIVRASSSPDITYQWLPTAGIPVSYVPTATITPDTSAQYILEGTILIPGTTFVCRTRDSLFIDVQPIPKVNMGGNRSLCQYDTIHITPTVTPGWYTLYSYDWTPGTFLDDSVSSYAVFTAGDTTKIVLTVSTPAGCSSSDSMIVYTYFGDFASLGADTSICPGDSVQLFPVSTEPGVTTYVWHPATYLNDSTVEYPVIKPINTISYKGIATSQYGCKDTIDYSIVVHPAAVVYLEDSVLLFPGESHQISPSSNCTYYSWTPAVGLNDTALSNPIANPSVSTKYILTARTEDGCKTTDSIGVRVVTSSVISVPNAFAPGSLNNTLKVILRGIARLRYFRVYNRWGNLVFEGKTIENGWDGTFNGTPQQAGVYVYEAEAVTSEGKILQKRGNVTLLK